MENLNLFLFISIAAPLGMMLLVFDNKSRKALIFLLAGMFIALFSGELNGILINNITDISQKYYSVNISPCIEEFLKSIPIFLYAFTLKPNKQSLIECSISVGVGFAILENASILANSADFISFAIALFRGFGAGIMHGLSCLMVGWGITFINTRKKLFFTGSIALLNLASIFHSIYNALALSKYQIAAFILPVSVFIPLLIFGIKSEKDYLKNKSEEVNYINEN